MPVLMLKKNDLAKQFELVVQQEIRNYQSSLNFVLQTLKELRELIDAVKLESLENYALVHSQNNSLEIEISSIKDTCARINQSLESSNSDQRTLNQLHSKQIKEALQMFAYQTDVDCTAEQRFNDIWLEIVDLKAKTNTNHQILSDNLDDLLRRFRTEIGAAKKEILEMPSHLSSIQTGLEEKIDSHKVDVAGIMTELRIFKHDNMVTQKKIENIYTLIERLQKLEAIP